MQDQDEGADDFDALLAEEAAEQESPEPARRARLRFVVPSALTTVFGAGIALALIGNAYAGTLTDDTAQVSLAPAVQQYAAPGDTQARTPRHDSFATEVAVVAAPVSGSSSGGSGSGKGSAVVLPSGPVAPAGTAQQYAAEQVAAHGWSKKDFACLVPMWARESGWNAHAGSPNGPYGIPQSYPGSKMASAGGDWLNDYRVQIRWGLGYIAGRYGSPCAAWAHWQTSSSY